MSNAAVPSAPIVVAYPTIMDGLVLRWYRDERGYGDAAEVASASRERAWFADPDGAPADLVAAVEDVHQRLARQVYGRSFGLIDERAYAQVRALATHRPRRLFSDELEPINAGTPR